MQCNRENCDSRRARVRVAVVATDEIGNSFISRGLDNLVGKGRGRLSGIAPTLCHKYAHRSACMNYIASAETRIRESPLDSRAHTGKRKEPRRNVSRPEATREGPEEQTPSGFALLSRAHNSGKRMKKITHHRLHGCCARNA